MRLEISPSGTFRSLRVRNYRLFASGQVVSLTGTWMQRIAQDWLVLSLTDNSGVALGITTALQFAPTWLVSMYAGVLADRFSKRRLLVATQVSMGILAVLLGILDVGGVITLWHVYVIAAMLGVVSAVDTPVRQSFVMEMVGRDDLPNAVSLNSATFNTARILGPAVAGVVITATGTGIAFLVNGASFVAVIAGLLMMRDAELFLSAPEPRAKGQLREGIRYVRSRPDLLMPIILIGIISTFAINFQITLALVAKRTFHGSAGAYGALSVALAVGSLIGALVSARRTQRPRQMFIVIAALAFGGMEIAVSVMPTFWVFLVVLVPVGAAVLILTNATNSAVQLGAAPRMRGRVMALYILVFLGGNPLGALVVGWITDAVGARWALASGGIITIVATVVVASLFARRGELTVVARMRPRPHLEVARARAASEAAVEQARSA